MSFEGVRVHRAVYAIVLLAVAIPGLFLGPAIMEPAYRVLQPLLGGMTLISVELLFALLIDFPLAMLCSALICGITRAEDPADGASAGFLFLFVFGLLIVGCLVLAPVGGPLIASLALSTVIPPAATSALQVLGASVVGLMGVMFVVFDLTLCTLGGIAGYHVARLFRRAS